jgi:autotransporter-associated beta strand protein
MAGASFTIVGGNLNGGTVDGGAAGGTGAGNGQALGGGLFLQGNETITLAPPSKATETISGVIADQTGSGGTDANAGAGGLILNGAGTLDLAAVNKFTGGVLIEQGELELSTSAAAGSGTITFASGTALKVVGLQSGITLGATISGFGPDDEVDFDAVGYATTEKVTYANGMVSVKNSAGATVASFDVTPGTYNFKLSADSDPSGNLVVSYAAPSIATALDFGAAPLTTIPEPSTWAMMLIGFAGLGYAAYRRHAATPVADCWPCS